MWYAYGTEPAKELKAREILYRLGYETALPTQTKKTKRSRHVKKPRSYQVPLLVGYIFVKVPEHIPWWSLFEYRIVRTIVGMGGKPTPISDWEIGSLMALSVLRPEHDKPVAPLFCNGDSVSIKSGPMVGQQGKVQSVQGDQAVAIFKMLGCDREVLVATDNIVAV